MRKAKNQYGTTLNVVEHVILKNFWEYYITDDRYNDDIVGALVMGDETEYGDVSLREVRSHAISCTTDLRELMPPAGYEWVN